jgi:hypothetical protein
MLSVLSQILIFIVIVRSILFTEVPTYSEIQGFVIVSENFLGLLYNPFKRCSFCRCKGLILLETYTTSEDSSVQKSLPQFLTIVEEVTGNPLYSMFNLSLREEWTTTKKFCHALQGKLCFSFILYFVLLYSDHHLRYFWEGAFALKRTTCITDGSEEHDTELKK